MKYDFQKIEQHWQTYWAENGTFRAANPGDMDFDPEKPKFYVLDMFPYPSGVGLHVGHPLGYIATDIVSRYKRMQGFNVLHPMGYDAFGLPAEQFAVEHGVHPRVTTEKNIDNMTRQLKRLGLSYDWDRCIATTDVDYYKWTQWIFLQMFNSWYDPTAGDAGAARPISELIRALESEVFYISITGELVGSDSEGMDAVSGTPIGARKWHELDAAEQREFLDRHRLAFMDEVPVNWCPRLGTVLANEEVTSEGLSERGNHPVFKRPLRQWMLRITAYADRLKDDLDLVAWPDAIKKMQQDWIGRSEGAEVDFALDAGEATSGETIRVYTTRPDTLFGATYMVLAPEHDLVDAITTDQQREAVARYRAAAAQRSDIERTRGAESKTKTGVFTGAHAINPVNNERIPIWIADYVLTGYGTGAIMAVPAHDSRDFEFARQFDLPIRAVVMADDYWLAAEARKNDGLKSLDAEALGETYRQDPNAFSEAFTGVGVSINSENDERILTGLPTPEAKAHITQWLVDKDLGRAKVQYKLRDWLFSRQRYWGEPFPILHGPDGEIVAVPESDLPVMHPHMEDFKPHGSDDPDAPPRPPLGNAPDDWKYVTIDGKQYTREFNTMPQWAGSCWYYLRFIDPKNGERFVSEEAEKYWMLSKKDKTADAHVDAEERSDEASGTQHDPRYHAGGIDLYVGGAEHAVLHLLYARFWHKVLYDLGHVSTPEPFGRLFNQGYIQAFAYTDERGVYVDAEGIVEKGDAATTITRKELVKGEMQNVEHKTTFYSGDTPVVQEYGKMGKSLKNAVNPDDMCEQYGCDSLRLYEMYLGPLEQSKPWSTKDIIGVHRFCQRLWRNFVNEETDELIVEDIDVADDLDRLKHKTIKRVTDCMNAMAFNTAIAALIELNNALVQLERTPRAVAEPLLLMLSPIAPHLAEELWHRLGNRKSIAYEPWPTYDEAKLVEDMIELPVQINGKVRGRINVPADADDATVEEFAKAEPAVQSQIEGKTVRKIIVIKGRMVNIVAN